jgi:predicted aldo/keto reductase-like oxidoreductase
MTLNLMSYFGNLAEESGKPSDCIACQQCEEHCPQHIDIVEKLFEVANVFEVN